MGDRIALEQLRIASPCDVPWESMQGDDRVRFCGQCRLNVYNLSSMSRREAEDFVGRREGRVCVSMLKRADGTVITRDCPIGLRAMRRRIAKLMAAAAAAAALLMAMVVSLATKGSIRRSSGNVAPASAQRTGGEPARTDAHVGAPADVDVGGINEPLGQDELPLDPPADFDFRPAQSPDGCTYSAGGLMPD